MEARRAPYKEGSASSRKGEAFGVSTGVNSLKQDVANIPNMNRR